MSNSSYSAGFVASRPNLLEAFLDSLLHAAVERIVPALPRKRFRQTLHFIHGVVEIVRVLIPRPISPGLHRAGWRIPQMHRHGLRAAGPHFADHVSERTVRRVRFRRHREINYRLRQREIPFGYPQEMYGL